MPPPGPPLRCRQQPNSDPSDCVLIPRDATLIIVIAGAVLSPGGDIASQMILSGPMLVLYIISIGIAWVFAKKKTVDPDA